MLANIAALSFCLSLTLMAACSDITTLLLHDQCELSSNVLGYGTLVTRVDGGWLNHRYFIATHGIKNIREGVFIRQEDAPNLYVAADVFDLALNAEAVFTTIFPGYEMHIKAVTDGWEYSIIVKTASGRDNKRDSIFVPRALRWVEKEYTADGSSSLTLVDQTLPTSNFDTRVQVYVGNGAHRFYASGATKQEQFDVTGTTQIDWVSIAPRNGETVLVRTLEEVSHV